MQKIVLNVLSALPWAFLLLAAFLVIASSLVFYALKRYDEVRAKFGHGKTIFEIETKKRRDRP